MDDDNVTSDNHDCHIIITNIYNFILKSVKTSVKNFQQPKWLLYVLLYNIYNNHFHNNDKFITATNTCTSTSTANLHVCVDINIIYNNIDNNFMKIIIIIILQHQHETSAHLFNTINIFNNSYNNNFNINKNSYNSIISKTTSTQQYPHQNNNNINTTADLLHLHGLAIETEVAATVGEWSEDGMVVEW